MLAIARFSGCDQGVRNIVSMKDNLSKSRIISKGVYF